MSASSPVVSSSSNALRTAFALALAAAVSLGLARFSYALLLPPMRADLGWSYTTAGAMNTANAAGYLLGALLAPRWFARLDPRRVMLAGGVASALALAAHALAPNDALLYALRALTGVGSAASFIGGGLLAARLAQRAPNPGLVLGLYYGGTGVGIVASSLVVPPLPWRGAWAALAVLALLCTVATAAGTRALAAGPVAAAPRGHARWAPLAFGLLGYLCFGLGYIGYMTFIVTLLREQHVAPALVIGFYVLLGCGVVASSWLWAGLLQRWRGGEALALLNALLAVATLLPVLSAHPLAVALSGALFGCVFLSVVASTTALVRHNLPVAAWPAGIAAFTIVFALGQIVGPSLVGWLADGPGGLVRGLAWSAGLLALGALLAIRQRPLTAV
jgi:predicted MFS family arabinose efflux permease